jgi:hypothetical protein
MRNHCFFSISYHFTPDLFDDQRLVHKRYIYKGIELGGRAEVRVIDDDEDWLQVDSHARHDARQ